MNSIFTNALPGQNEDAHTYTLKERFNQENEENSGNNNINNNDGSDIHRYENPNEDQIMPEMRREKFKDYNDQNDLQDYPRSHYYNRSRSRSRSRNGSRDRYRREQRSRSKKYSRSNSPLFSYTENGVTKINTYFTVPDHLVSLLIGKKGENVRAIMNSTGAVVTFCKEVR